MIIFNFFDGECGKSEYQEWESINWRIKTMKDESEKYLNIYLGAKALPGSKKGDFFIVELTADIYKENEDNDIGKKIIPTKQALKMKHNSETFLCLDTGNEDNYTFTVLSITLEFHSIKMYKDNCSLCDPLEFKNKYHSIPEKQEVQVNNGSDYIKFPNCEFGNPSFKKSDLVVQIGDFQLFCHSQILSLNSPFFSEIIDETKEENKKKEEKYMLELSDIDNIVDFQNFLYLIYNPRYIPNSQNVENILNYADKFQVDVVKEACEDFLLNGTHSFPVETLAAIAWRFNLQELKKSLDSSMTSMKFKDVFNCEHYQKASDANKNEMCELTILKFSP